MSDQTFMRREDGTLVELVRDGATLTITPLPGGAPSTRTFAGEDEADEMYESAISEMEEEGAESIAPEDAIEAILVRRAWQPHVEPGPGDDRASRFGGLPWLAAANNDNDWPTCQDCGRRMAFVLQLHLDAAPLDCGHGLLQLFLCERAGCAPHNHLLRILDTDSDTDINSNIDAPGAVAREPAPREPGDLHLAPDAPYHVTDWSDVEDQPGAGDEDGRALLDRYPPLLPFATDPSGDTHPGIKLGGWPYWHEQTTGCSLPRCRTCDGPTRLLLQLDYGKSRPRILPDFPGIALISQCPTHTDNLDITWTT